MASLLGLVVAVLLCLGLLFLAGIITFAIQTLLDSLSAPAPSDPEP